MPPVRRRVAPFPADIDEGAVKDSFSGDPAALALKLAELKALEVSKRRPGALVLGSDQVLEFEGVAYDKARSVAEAEARLRQLRGQTHYLQGGIALARDHLAASGDIHAGHARVFRRFSGRLSRQRR